MNTRKFRILCDGQFIGFIFICDDNARFPNYIIATICPFQRQGGWDTNELELVGQRAITDIFNNETTDEDIQNNLLQRSNINSEDCRAFQIIPY